MAAASEPKDRPGRASRAGAHITFSHGFSARHRSIQSSGITSVIWATGYKFDFSLVRLPVLDGDGFPTQKRGVSVGGEARGRAG